MVRWQELSANEMTLLDRVFWSSGISREALAERSSFSKSRANAAVAGMLEQGVLEVESLCADLTTFIPGAAPRR